MDFVRPVTALEVSYAYKWEILTLFIMFCMGFYFFFIVINNYMTSYFLLAFAVALFNAASCITGVIIMLDFHTVWMDQARSGSCQVDQTAHESGNFDEEEIPGVNSDANSIGE